MIYRLTLLPAAAALLLYACGSDSDNTTAPPSPAPDTTAPLPAALVATIPASPSIDSTPAVRGNAEAGASVRLYTDLSCAGPAFGTGIADGSGAFLAAVFRPVVGDVLIQFHATATDAAGNVSDCSAPLAYFSPIPDASFAEPTESPFDVGLDARPLSVAIGDLDGDGDLDLVTANFSTPGNVSVLLGDGDGTFGAANPFPVDANGPASVAIGDLDGDGDLDLVTANELSDDVSVLLGNGDGTFDNLAAENFDVGDGPRSVAIGDLDGDGDLDLAVANRNSDNVSVLLGDGDGTFDDNPATDFPVGNSPVSVAIGDLNGNGNLDIVTANELSNDVSVLLGNGDGTFGAASRFGTDNGPRSVAIGDLDGDIGDLNGDGRLDLVTANRGSNNVSVLPGDGDGTFGAAKNVSIGTNHVSVAIGDLNGDGRLDFVAANETSDDVSVLLNQQ